MANRPRGALLVCAHTWLETCEAIRVLTKIKTELHMQPLWKASIEIVSTLKKQMAKKRPRGGVLVHTRPAVVGASKRPRKEEERAMLVSIGQQGQQVAAAAAGKSCAATNTKRLRSKSLFYFQSVVFLESRTQYSQTFRTKPHQSLLIVHY